jgi:hypothetical protein
MERRPRREKFIVRASHAVATEVVGQDADLYRYRWEIHVVNLLIVESSRASG